MRVVVSQPIGSVLKKRHPQEDRLIFKTRGQEPKVHVTQKVLRNSQKRSGKITQRRAASVVLKGVPPVLMATPDLAGGLPILRAPSIRVPTVKNGAEYDGVHAGRH